MSTLINFKCKIVPHGKRYIMLPLGVGVTYAEKNGGLVLKTETTWRKINGIWINTNRGCLWLQFRRISI